MTSSFAARHRSIVPAIALSSLLLSAADAAAAPWPPAKRTDRQAAVALREEVHEVPVAGTGASIVVTSFRPSGAGPHPFIVLSHGTAATLEANQKIDRNRNPQLVQQWLQRGYAVIVPIRRGYGASGGERLADDYGNCRRPDFARAGEAAALDLLATIAWAKTQRDLDAKRWLLVGQSAGGFASIYTASKQPDGLVAVLAFAPGRAGASEQRGGTPCSEDSLAALFASIAPQIKVPVLWFYAENDALFGPNTARLWFDAFRYGGGRGELVVVPPFPAARGHGVFTASAGVPLWTAAVARFFANQKITLPF